MKPERIQLPLAHQHICTVVKTEQLNSRVLRLWLEVNQPDHFSFEPGQYLNLINDDGIKRSFSIANPPDSALIELHIALNGNSPFLHWIYNEFRENVKCRIEAPLGKMILRNGSVRPILFLAGGTGFAPIKGMLQHAFSQDDRRLKHLFWGTRKPCEMYLPNLPKSWIEQHKEFRFTPVVEEPTREWSGETGLVHMAAVRQYNDLSTFDAYLCGPPDMVKSTGRILLEQGLPRERIFSDFTF